MADEQQTTKQIALKFLVSEDESAKIRKWVNEELIRRNVQVDQPLTEGVKDLRSDVRVQLQNVECTMITEPGKTLPEQSFKCFVDDLSAGGGCVTIPQAQPLVKGGGFRLELKFIAQDFSVHGKIVGLRKF